MKKSTLSLQRTILFAACTGLLVPALIANCYSWYDTCSTTIEQQTKKIAEQNARILAIGIAEAVATANQGELKTVLEEAMQHDPEIVQVEIKNQANLSLAFISDVTRRQDPLSSATNTIYFLGQAVGRVEVQASGARLKQAAFSQLQIQLWALAAQILLTLLLLNFLLNKRLFLPLSKLQEHIKTWSTGELQSPISDTESHEVNLLTQQAEETRLALRAIFNDLAQEKERLAEVQNLSENRFFNAFHSNLDAMSITRMSDATLIEANDAFEKLTGYTQGAWKGKSTLQLGLWTNPEQRVEFINAVKKSGSTRDFPCNIRNRDRVSSHCLVNAALFDIQGVQYLFVILRDITSQHFLEEQKAEADHALLRLAQGTHGGDSSSFFASLVSDLSSALRTDCAFIALRDTDKPDSMHTLAMHLHGKAADNFDYKVLGSPCERAMAGEITIFAQDVKEIFSANTTFSRDGWDSYAGAPLHNAHGDVIGVMAVMHARPLRNPDLVRSLLQVFSERASAELERKRTEEELRLSEQRFATIFHSTPVPMFVTQLSDNNIIKDINSAFENLFLHRRADVVGKSTLDLAIYDNPQDRHTLLNELTQTGKIELHDEVWMLRGDGAKILIHFSCNTFSFDGEKFAVFSCQDVTEKRSIEQEIRELNASLEDRVIERTEELQQANQELETTLDALNLAQAELVNSEKLAALGALVAGISHELNTPIGNSLMVASTLYDQTTSLLDSYRTEHGIKRSTLESYLGDTRKAGDILTRNLQRAADLVNSFKQVAIDQISSQRREFTLSEVVNEILLTLWPIIRKSPYTVEQNIPDKLCFDSYPGPLGQVLTNLINNALLHGFEGKKHGNVKITARVAEHDSVELTVSDDGIGIPADRLRKIFDPFFTTRLGAGGSGLGLNITHNIVTGVLGGRIRVSSAVDVGTSFVILLPLVAPAKKSSDEILHP